MFTSWKCMKYSSLDIKQLINNPYFVCLLFVFDSWRYRHDEMNWIFINWINPTILQQALIISGKLRKKWVWTPKNMFSCHGNYNTTYCLTCKERSTLRTWNPLLSTARLSQIKVRERGNQSRTIQRYCQHRVHKTKTKNKAKTQHTCVLETTMCKQAQTT